jgi:hypothetical protein
MSDAVTDEEGRFLLRNLPAGELTVTLDPAVALPGDLITPTGRVRMPIGPTQIDNATIVIDNPRLIDYLAPAPPASGTR